jgi:VCBS repeat-containing protein
VAQDQTAITNEDTPVTATFAADDIDSDDSGSSLVYQILTGPAKGSATVNANGTFTFNPGVAFQALNTGQSEQVSFTYHATDSHGAVSTTQTVTVTVNGADEPPPGPITVEAESLTLAGYQVEGNGAASGGALIRLPLGGTQGTATLQSFTGATGTYDLNVSYFDENDGASTFSVLVNGTVVGNWTANAPGPDSLAGADDLKVQTLAGLSLHTGDTIAIRGTVDGNEFARVDKLAFAPAQAGTFNYEAENLVLSGYQVEANAAASGGALIRIPLGAAQGAQGTATLQNFAGASGNYDLQIAYFDENDGAATFNVLVNGNVVGSWVANAPGPDALAGADNLMVHTLSAIALHQGDTIALRGTFNGDEYARIDALHIAAHSDPVV